ncbi:MAG TPA: tannase/feruloyl esterase family alpha/beta hydrolase [Terracidiphilus sp.]|nr:tannase/feruloyl esterase family alpha/beta hydrolase [Terracidiphilus sp.]
MLERSNPWQFIARYPFAFFIAVVLLLPLAVPCARAATPCHGLIALMLPDTNITSAEEVPAGPFKVQGFTGSTNVIVPAFCRVTATIRAAQDSEINFELWMPASTWNHRFEGVGNGGLGGMIGTQAMAAAVREGYATASTDTGHTGGPATGQWALGHPEKVIDFGYRAVHEMTLRAKSLISSYYGKGAAHSYWNGCSEGGGQGLSEAQRFPTDYDGIVAGAPANNFVHLQAGGNWISQAIHEDPATFIAPAKLPAITAAVLAQCDAADGVKDGVLEDPRTCKFDPSTLLCKGDESDTCLTAPQIDGLRKIYDGARNPRTGEQIFPGTMRGGEAGWGFWIAGTDAPPRNLQHAIMIAFFDDLVYENPNWDWRTFNFDKDVSGADAKVGAALNQINPNLSAFKRHGGKLIQYHGWNDPAISPLNSIDYFESVQKKMGVTTDFYRLFMVPGMEHCTAGPGVYDFDRMSAIVDWVEDGHAPDQIIASRPARTRPLCPYPQAAKYGGSGSTDLALNFSCAAP